MHQNIYFWANIGKMILLDSQVSGVPHGELSAYQLDWLKNKIS